MALISIACVAQQLLIALRFLGIPYSVDMGCTDDKSVPHDIPNLRICGGHPGPTTHAWELALPLYQSDPECSGQTSGSCDSDIIQAPVNFSSLSDRYGAFASEFIGNVSHDARPFFLYVPFSHIHTPQYVAARNVGRSNRTGQAGHFYDTLMELDDTVGVVTKALEAAGVDNNTLILVSGDNGPWEVKCNLSGSPGPYTGLWQKKQGGGGSSAKTTLWEGGHREVGLARWPGKIAPRVSNATASTLDYLPTLLSLAGVKLPSDREYDGIDLTPVLLQGSEQAHETLFHPNSGASGPDGQLDGVRWKNWKAIFQTGGAPDCSKNKGNIMRHDPPLLFDLSKDEAEEFALDTSQEPYSSVVKQIKTLLAQQMHSVNTTMQSVVNYTAQLASEPCAHYPSTCRTGPTPGPPPPPPPPSPSGPPICNASQWWNHSIPWKKAYPQPPFSKPVGNIASAEACCKLCASPENYQKGCAFWVWDISTNECYMKQHVTMTQPHPAADFVAGSVHPVNI